MAKKTKAPEHVVDSTVVGERGQVVIPKDIRDRAGLKPGARLLVMQPDPCGPIVLFPADHMKAFVEDMTKKLPKLMK